MQKKFVIQEKTLKKMSIVLCVAQKTERTSVMPNFFITRIKYFIRVDDSDDCRVFVIVVSNVW